MAEIGYSNDIREIMANAKKRQEEMTPLPGGLCHCGYGVKLKKLIAIILADTPVYDMPACSKCGRKYLPETVVAVESTGEFKVRTGKKRL